MERMKDGPLRVKHSFLAHVFQAVESEHVRRSGTVSDEVLGLSNILREVFKDNSWDGLL